jgi:probable rRNA maturation factor
MIEIEIANQQSALAIDREVLVQAAQAILQDHGPSTCSVSIAIVDDPTMHTLNRQYLQHDYATDVLSFVLEQSADLLEGEVIVSSDTALAQADQYQWTPADELLLYVIHGLLHLVGFDDQTDVLREEMRCAERTYLRQCGRLA